MDPIRWQKIKSLLEIAIEMPPELRSGFLDRSCDHDQSLIIEINELLRFETDGSDPLEELAFSSITPKQTTRIGTEIGRYRIIDELGAGGMGTVFLAERSDGEFEQRVAIKIINSSVGFCGVYFADSAMNARYWPLSIIRTSHI